MNRKHALVTGSSKGIGKAVALQLARDGYDLTLVARQPQALQAAAAEIAGLGTRVLFQALDLSQWDNAGLLLAGIERDAGRLDLVVNNAGDGKRCAIHDLTADALQAAFGAKFTSTCSVTQAAWPLLVKSGGQVINMVGALSRTPNEQSLIGSAVCGALLGFTKALAEQGRQDGVRVNAVNPGWIDTGRLGSQLESIAARDGHSDLAKARSRLLADIRMTRIGAPEDVAAVIGFLASPAASLIHGAAIDVDGGMTKGL